LTPVSETDQKEFRKARLVAFAMAFLTPLVCLAAAWLQDSQRMASGGTNDLFVYILLIISVVDGGLMKVVERVQINKYRRNPHNEASPAKFFVTITIITMTVADAVFIFGFIAVQVTGEALNMLWFYLIGAVWAVVYWPRRDKFERFVQELQKS
jgi:hypothetical protein